MPVGIVRSRLLVPALVSFVFSVCACKRESGDSPPIDVLSPFAKAPAEEPKAKPAVEDPAVKSKPPRQPRPAKEETLEDRLKAAREHEEKTKKREQEELAQFKLRAEWSYRFRAAMDDRHKAFYPLLNPIRDALIKASLKASDARDEKSRERLTGELHANNNDPLKVPQSAEVRSAAREYAEKRLEIERRFVKQLTELKETMPMGVAVGDRRQLSDELAAAERGVRMLDAALTDLPALPDAKQPDPKTAVAQLPKDKKPVADPPKKETPPAEKEPEYLGPAPRDWAVAPDPLKEKLEFPKQLGYSFDRSDPTMVYYPLGPSAYVAVGSGRGSVDGFSIFDLRSGKKVGQASGIDVRVDRLSAGGPALSPDGTYLAMHDFIKKSVLIGNVKARKGTAILPFDDDHPIVLFPTPTQVLAIPTSKKVDAKLWELPSGKALRSFPVIESICTDSGRVACSAGGRFLAIAAEGSTPHSVHFYDLSNGKPAGTIKAPGGSSRVDPWFSGMAFSQDGTQFAGFITGVQVGMNIGEAMACWDVKTGRLTYYRHLDRGEGRGMLTTPTPEPLQWFPDDKGWLLFQRYVVDRDAGAVTDGLKADDGMFAHFGTKIIDNRHVLISSPFNTLKPVEVRRFVKK